MTAVGLLRWTTDWNTKNSVGLSYQFPGVLKVTLLNGPFLLMTYALTIQVGSGQIGAAKASLSNAFG